METYSDEKLAILAAKNNKEALETLVARYLKLVYSFVFRYARNQQDAEDITQEIFVKVWRNLRKFDQSKTFRPWLYKIAKNTCLDFLKKKPLVSFSGLNGIENTEWLAQNLASASPSPEISLDQTLLKNEFAAAIKKLSPKYAETLSLHQEQGLNFREIAEATQESQNTVKSRYRRALIKLKQLLSK